MTFTVISSFIFANFIPIAIAVGLAIGMFIFRKIKQAGVEKERAKNLKAQQKERRANDKTIKKASDARRNVDPDGVSNDPYNRDR